MGVRRVLAAACSIGLGSLAVVAACGDRTALPETELAVDATVPGRDAGPDSELFDGLPGDAVEGVDAAFDVFGDVPPDVSDDVPVVTDCPDGAATFIYVITEDDRLYSFYPPTGDFTFIGTLDCPGSSGVAWSMAVDRVGNAYVLYKASSGGGGGPVYQVDTGTAACKSLPYKPGQMGFDYFGMGFATNGDGPSETLYIEGDAYLDDAGATGLASLDTTTWLVTPIGSTTPPIQGGELTGTGTGDLYVFFFYEEEGTTYLGQLDKTTGQLITSMKTAVTIGEDSFAMAYWGGDFYFFTDTAAAQYSPMTGKTVANYATLSGGHDIVGAGVSTCAPH
jgi:hypothetical protein